MLGIVIVSYRSDEQTIRFVREEMSRIRVPHRIVVVDNGVGAGQVSPMAKLLTGVAVISTDNNGYAAGNNAGATWLLQQGPVSAFLFTNTDLVLASDDVVDKLYGRLMELYDVGAIGPEVVGLDGCRQSPRGYLGLWDRYVWMYLSTPFLSPERKNRRFLLDYAERAQEGPHYFLSGSFLMVKASCWEEMGHLDEETFLYAEENILFDRLQHIGKCCWFYPQVRVIHEHAKTINAAYDARKRGRMQFESMAYYYRTYRGYSVWECRMVSLVFRIVQWFKPGA